jgi:PAS domain-containing protein
MDEEIARAQRLIWGFAGGTGLLLYAALALVIWKATAGEEQALRKTREARERLEAILAGIADRMMIVDRQMRVVWMNKVAAEGLDRGAGGLDLPCFQVLGVQTEECQGCPAVRTFLSGKVERGVRTQRLPGDQVRYLDLVTAPLRDTSGRVHQVLEVARDITELVEMEERLKHSAARLEGSHAALLAKTAELERANAALRETQAQLVEKERLAAADQVLVGLHHAILNPLTGILGALQVLKEEGTAPVKKAEALAEAVAEIRKLERLIRRLPKLQSAAGSPYVGDTTMLDLERLCPEEKP